MIGISQFVKVFNRPKVAQIASLLRPYSDVATTSPDESSENFLKYDADPIPQFMRKENRYLLQSLTCLDLAKVFRYHPMPFERSSYHFVTAEELKAKIEGSLRMIKRVLFMPPIMQIDDDNIEVIATDPELQGIKPNSKYIFIDTTYGLKDRERTICVRLPNGVLQTADQSTRRRMLQTYFPLDQRKLFMPQMFGGEHFQRILNEGKYLFMLNRCIVQFEPYEKDYHRVTSLTYQHINEKEAFDSIRSTRHFGPMAFFLAWHKMIDKLVIDCIRRDYLNNAVEAICLMYNLNNISYDSYILEQMKKYPKIDTETCFQREINKATSEAFFQMEIIEKTMTENLDDACLEFLNAYCDSEHVQNPTEIKTAIQTYRERAEQRKKEIEGLQKAHGIN